MSTKGTKKKKKNGNQFEMEIKENFVVYTVLLTIWETGGLHSNHLFLLLYILALCQTASKMKKKKNHNNKSRSTAALEYSWQDNNGPYL